jgi:para-nitrobenzyl esterase
MALQWVQDNIEKFGGDRNNVTIVGASAGAQNVSYLMHTHLAKDLFHKAIMESNYPGIRPVDAATKSSKQVLYNLLVADPGNSIGDSSAAKIEADAMDPADIRDYFYASTPEQIYNTYFNWYWGPINWGDFYRSDIVSDNTWTPPPIVQIIDDRPEFVYSIGDGYVLPNDIDFADFSKGQVYPKPIVVGTTLNENNAWNAWWPFNYSYHTPLAELVDGAVNGGDPYLMAFGPTEAEFMANYKFATELIDELDMYLGAQLSARNLAQAKPGVPIYVYRFDWGASTNRNYMIPEEEAWKFYVGAPHTQEYDFFWQRFGDLAAGDSANAYEYTDANLRGRQDLSAAALSYLAEFIHDRKGKIKKNRDQPTEWERWDRKKEQFIVFDGDYQQAHVAMNGTDIYRTPEQLYAAYLSHPNEIVRDFIAYYVAWSWHYNWYPNAAVGPFDTSPGVNPVFDPLDP